ncbi:hypothetical protein P9112_012772 [Eukaryota sp. TZLM1-RC]
MQQFSSPTLRTHSNLNNQFVPTQPYLDPDADIFYLKDFDCQLDLSDAINHAAERIDTLVQLYSLSRRELSYTNFTSALSSILHRTTFLGDSTIDSATHHLLRYAVANSSDNSLLDIFCTAESLIFFHRIHHLQKDPTSLRNLAFSVPELDARTVAKEENTDVPYPCVFSIPITHLDWGEMPVVKGRAYIQETHMVDVLRSLFSHRLRSFDFKIKEYKSNGHYGNLINQDLDDVIQLVSGYFSHSLHSLSVNSFSTNSSISSHNDIESLSSSGCLPLCMDVMFTQLTNEGHLKHEGRLNLGLALKGCGLSVEQNLELWRRKMTKKISNTEFEKKYAYNIKHHYGTVGGGRNYGPPSCLKLNDTSSRPDYTSTFHGCPWKYMTFMQLRKTLIQRGLSVGDAEKLAQKGSDGHSQLACRDYGLIKSRGKLKKEEFYFEAPHQYLFGMKEAVVSASDDVAMEDEDVMSDVSTVKSPVKSPLVLPKRFAGKKLSPLPKLPRLGSPQIGSPLKDLAKKSGERREIREIKMED